MHRPFVILLSPYDILRPRTNQLSDVRFTEGFAQNNCHAHIIVPFVYRKDNIPKEEVHEIYGLTHRTHIHYLPTGFRNDVHGAWPLILVATLSFFRTFGILRTRKHHNTTYIISRSTHLIRPFLGLKRWAPFLLKNVKIIHWAHDLHTSGKYTGVYKRSDFLLATNSSTLESMLKLVNRSKSDGCITLNPVTNQQAVETLTQEEARKQIQLENLSAPLVVYTGKIGMHYDRELRHIFTAAKMLPSFQFLLTGGKQDTVRFWEEYCEGEGISNIQFTGYIHDYRRVRLYQYAADVLISYYTDQAHDTRYNLPNKICEYMIAGRIIVTPDYPATRDLLRNDNCHFVRPDDSMALAEGIRYVIEHRSESDQKAARASKEAREFSFRKIAATILLALPK